MNENILTQIIALPKMEAKKLKQLWHQLYQTEPPEFFNRRYFVKRLAYRIQELAFGTNTKLEQRLASLAEREPTKRNKKHLEVYQVIAGTRLMREWKGEEHHVIANKDGFQYNGMHYKSLSAIARKITGTRWNGLVFFGIKRMGGSK